MRAELPVRSAALLLPVLLFGCTDLPSEIPRPDEAVLTNRSIHARNFRNVDEEFTYLAEWVPGGFGGLSFDPEGGGTVYLKDLRKQGGAAGVLNAHFQQRAPGEDRRDLRGLRFVQGDYDFRELVGWRRAVNAEWPGLPGISSTDIDEARNRIRIGIAPGTAEGPIRAAIAKLRIPTDAVIIEEEEVEDPVLRLDDVAPAVAGGYFIQWPSGGCTLGFNAYQGTNRVFVTASHCSATRFGYDGHSYFQWRTLSAGDRIGYEYFDPQPYYDSVCHPTYNCRWADALLGMWTVSRWDYGRIARTQGGPNAGSLVVDPVQPTFSIIGEIAYGMVGDEVHKVGAITGWTRANITRTCVSQQIGTTYTPCQEEAFLGGQSGDSGAPVFSLTAYPGWVRLRGVLSKPSAFSNMFDIEWDLGSLQTALCTTANPLYPYC